jgi:hypothetical protein
MKFLTLILVALSATTATGLAQTAASAKWPPMAGTRARILSPVFAGERRVGTIESATGDTLQFRPAEGFSVSLKPSEITTIDVSTGTHSSKAKWAAIGFVAGAAAGAAIGSATYTPCKDSFACIGDIGGRKGSIALGAIFGALSGGIAGALLGAHRRETWAPVRLDSSQR